MRININKIEWKNIFSYGNKWQSFEPNGICFITGHNLNTDRRNFTGKSNLLKIFPYSLYGKVEGLNKSRIVNWKNRKNAESFVTLNKGSDTYIIHRGIKPDILEVTKNGNSLPIPSNKKDFQNQIEEEILEMDYMSFMQTVYADVNNTKSVLNMGKPDKRAFLENIFYLQYFTSLREKANKKINATNNKIDGTNTKIEEKEKRLSELLETKNRYENELNNLQDSSKELKQKENELDKSKNQYKKILSLIDTINKEINSFKENIHLIDKNKVKFTYKIKELNKQIVKDSATELLKLNKDKTKELKQKENELDSLKEKEIEYNKLIEKYDKRLDSDKDQLIEKTSSLKTKYNHNKTRLEEVEQKIKNKITDSKCPFCFQGVNHDLIDNHLNSEKEQIEIDINNSYNKMKKTGSLLIKKKKEIEQRDQNEQLLNNIKNKINNTQNDLKELKTEIKELENSYEKALKSKKYESVIKKLKAKENQFTIKIEKINDNIINKNNELANEEKNKKQFEQLEKEIEHLKINIDNEQKQRKTFKKWITDSENNYDKIKKEIKEDKNNIVKLKTTSDYIEYIREICSDDKARAYAISQKIPLLNKKTNYYLSKCGTNYYIKLDNWLDVDIRGPGIKDCTYQNLSGAERVSLDRSLQFALNDLSKLQSPSYYDLLVLDEILDSSIDNTGLQNMINIITAKQREDKSNILIVSHKNNFSELSEKIDNFYVVENDGKYSYIKKQ